MEKELSNLIINKILEEKIQDIDKRISNGDENIKNNAKLFLDLHNKLYSQSAKRITPDVKEKIIKFCEKNDFPPDKEKITSFEKIQDEIGITYLLLINKNNSEEAFPLRIRCSETYSGIKNDKVLKKDIEYLISAAKKLINKYLPPEYIINYSIFDKLNFNLIDHLNNAVTDIQFEGKSFMLPFFITLFSYLLQEKVPVKYAATGRIVNEDKIEFVEGIESKFNAAKKEYPEIEFLITKTVLESEPVKNVNNIEEALNIFFPDFKDKLKKGELIGAVKFIGTSVETNAGKALLLGLEKHIGIETEYLKRVPKIIEKFRQELDKNDSNLILTNIRVLWLNAAFVAEFKNHCNFIAEYDPVFTVDDPKYNRAAIKVWEKRGSNIGEMIYYNENR
jgi:hypothetical protein